MPTQSVWNTKSLLRAVCEAKNLSTDYQLAKHLGADRSTVSLWVRGARVMSDEWGTRVAQVLGLDPAYVCLCLATERSTDANLAAQMRAWLTAHATAASVFYAVISGLFLLSVTAQSHAAAGVVRGAICILC